MPVQTTSVHTHACAPMLTLSFEVLAPLVSIPEQEKARQRQCCCFASAGCRVTGLCVARKYLLLLIRLSRIPLMRGQDI